MRNIKDEYSDKEECEQALAEYNKDKEPAEQRAYFSYFNSMKRKRMYVPCTIDYFKAWRNMLAEEHRKEDLESRCLVPSQRYHYLKKCMEDCKNCPYGKDKRDGYSYSYDKAVEDGLIPDGKGGMKPFLEQADTKQNPLEKKIAKERNKALNHELSLLNEEDRKLLDLFSNGLNDEQIGKELGLKRSTVQYKRSRLIEDLREKLKKIL